MIGSRHVSKSVVHEELLRAYKLRSHRLLQCSIDTLNSLLQSYHIVRVSEKTRSDFNDGKIRCSSSDGDPRHLTGVWNVIFFLFLFNREFNRKFKCATCAFSEKLLCLLMI